MAIERIGAARPDQSVLAAQASTTVSSQRQGTEASARVTEPVPGEEKGTRKEEESALGNGSEGQSEQTVDNETLKKKVGDLNKQLQTTECQYGIHEETQRVTLKIVDKETKEVLKEFPPEKTLEMIAKVWEMAGLLVDEKR
jgi:flagellar protein FlaG